MENKYKLWVARDWCGMLYAYFNKPIRDTVWKEWDSDKVSLSIDDSFYPELKWEDEPIEVELRPAITDLDTKANDTAKQLPDKCVKALDKYLDNLTKEENQKENEQ